MIGFHKIESIEVFFSKGVIKVNNKLDITKINNNNLNYLSLKSKQNNCYVVIDPIFNMRTSQHVFKRCLLFLGKTSFVLLVHIESLWQSFDKYYMTTYSDSERNVIVLLGDS